MKCAVVTIAVGEKYLNEYNEIFRNNTELYCKKHGYDFYVITDYIFEDIKYNQPIFVNIMKWTLPYYKELQKYDRIAIVDADILITSLCPPIESLDLGDKIGIVDEYSQPTLDTRIQIQRANNWPDTSPSEYYKVHLGIDILTNHVFNGGFYICSPSLHGKWFRDIFTKHVDGTLSAKLHPFHFEQAMLGYELITQNMYKILPNEWNRIWPINSHRLVINPNNLFAYHLDLYNKSYIMHYCAKCGWEFAKYCKGI